MPFRAQFTQVRINSDVSASQTQEGGVASYVCYLKHLKYAVIFTLHDTVLYNILRNQIRLMVERKRVMYEI